MLELSFLARVLIAAALSGVIGLEREFHGRPAGLRTHLLVGAGAALVVVTFEAVPTILAQSGAWGGTLRVDPGRVAAGIITGIGFLGAGTILRVGDWVRGLTTAASIWFVAGVGITAGEGLYVLAVGGTAIGLTVLGLIDRIEQRIPSAVYHSLSLTVHPEKREEVRRRILNHCRSAGMRAQVVGWEWGKPDGLVTIRIRIRHRGTVDLSEIGEAAAAVPGVERVELSG